MCKCELLVEARTAKTINIPEAFHTFSYANNSEKVMLLDKIKMTSGKVNYAAAYEIEDMHGFKKGYMLIMGEKDDAQL